MPIYEFRCRKCRRQFETLVRSSEKESDLKCPSCGEPRAERILSVFSSSGTESRAGEGGGCGHSHRKGFS